MEVASPIALPPVSAAAAAAPQRCSPMMDTTMSNKRNAVALTAAQEDERSTKRRRRFATTLDVDSLSEDFSSHSIFYNKSNGAGASSKSTTTAGPSVLKRLRPVESSNHRSGSPSSRDELNRVVQEQASLIESLKKDKSGLEDSLQSLQTDHARVVKENGILRKAVAIQQERQTAAETEAKAVKQQADERIQSLEQIILTLRYHLQQQQPVVGNDFMHQRPPDVY